jgi:hypothetical protein
MSAQDGSGKMNRKVIEFRPLWREIQRAIPLEGLVTEERDAMSGRSVSGEKCEGLERNSFVWFVCKMLLTFFTVIAVDPVAVSLLTHKLRLWFPVWLDAHWATRTDP